MVLKEVDIFLLMMENGMEETYSKNGVDIDIFTLQKNRKRNKYRFFQIKKDGDETVRLMGGVIPREFIF